MGVQECEGVRVGSVECGAKVIYCIVALLDLCQHATAGVLPSNSVTVVSGM